MTNCNNHRNLTNLIWYPKLIHLCGKYITWTLTPRRKCPTGPKTFILEGPVCDGTQNDKRYRYRYFFKYFRYRYRYFFRYQIFPIPFPRLFTDTGSETFFRCQIFPIPVLIPPEKMKNSRYRFRYPLEIF